MLIGFILIRQGKRKGTSLCCKNCAPRRLGYGCNGFVHNSMQRVCQWDSEIFRSSLGRVMHTIVQFTDVECMTSEQGQQLRRARERVCVCHKREREKGRALHGTHGALTGASSLQCSDDLSLCIICIGDVQNRLSISEEKSA